MTIGVPKETFGGERRVALVPAHVKRLTDAGCTVLVEAGAGLASGYPDELYRERGAEAGRERNDVISGADILLTVRCSEADPDASAEYASKQRHGQLVVGTAEPYNPGPGLSALLESGATLFAMELIPRITRAQSMDALSSMANLAGYKAVIMAAERLSKMFPMMMTAAGTIVPARVFVVGAGVAGLQAIATARRLGAVVSAYDIRPAAREQVESLGARFMEIGLESEESETSGGYAREMDQEFYRKQREAMTEAVRDSHVVITTAAVPGRRAPVLVTTDMVEQMHPGSVIVDLAAERGGNCDLTEAGRDVTHNAVTIVGPVNVPSALAFDASQLYSRNITEFVSLLIADGGISIPEDDEIVRETLVAREGRIVNETVQGFFESASAQSDGSQQSEGS